MNDGVGSPQGGLRRDAELTGSGEEAAGTCTIVGGEVTDV